MKGRESKRGSAVKLAIDSTDSDGKKLHCVAGNLAANASKGLLLEALATGKSQTTLTIQFHALSSCSLNPKIASPGGSCSSEA